MASESVKILIEAEDQASAKLANATERINANVKKIKETGERAKKSTEFVGTIGTILGGSELGSFASQLGGLIEKTSQFSEVSKAGGAGAMAFKAGLVAAAAAIGFSVGNALGNVIFQTEKWAKKLEDAKERFKELSQQISDANQQRFEDQVATIEVRPEGAEKVEDFKKLQQELKTEILGVEQRVKGSQKAVEEWNKAWQITGDRKGFAEQAKMQLQQDKERLKQLQQQEKQIQRTLGIEAELDAQRKDNTYLENLSKQLALLEAQQADTGKINEAGKTQVQILQEEIALLEQRNFNMATFAETARQAAGTDEGVDAATELLVEMELKKKQIELEKELAKEKQKRSDEEFSALQKLEQLERSQLDSIRLKTIEATKGKEAREAEALVMQGMDRADADRLARQQAAADKQLETSNKLKEIEKDIALKNIEATKGKLARDVEQMVMEGMDRTQAEDVAKRQAEADARLARKDQQPLQAFVSRFLTRGPTEPQRLEDLGKQQVKSLAEAVGFLKSLDAEARKPRKELKLGIDGA